MRRRTLLSTGAGLTAALITPAATAAEAAARPRPRRPHRPHLSRDTEALLRGWFADTYRSMQAMTTDLGLATDNITVTGSAPVLTVNTSPTNIGCGIWSTVAAAGLGVISQDTMHRALARTVNAVERMERHHGFWLNWYDAHTGKALTTWPGGTDPIRPFLSTVDNAWLDTGLRIAAEADPALRTQIARIRSTIDWSHFYKPYDPADPAKNPGQLYGGQWSDNNEFTGHWYGALNTEPRMAGYLGIADGTVPTEHYWHTNRTLDPGAGQEQQPDGEWVTVDGVRMWRGHYTYRGRKLVPSWGGSMFEALMVPLFVPEGSWSPDSWGLNHQRYVRSQIEHGMVEADYGYWGFSPAAIPAGGYREYGVDPIGMAADGYNSLNTVTPHAAFLAMPYAQAEAIDNLKRLAADFGAYHEGLGFRDSVDVSTGQVCERMLALDQGMIAAALAQVLSPGLLQRPFTTGNFTTRVRPLLTKENFGIA